MMTWSEWLLSGALLVSVASKRLCPESYVKRNCHFPLHCGNRLSWWSSSISAYNLGRKHRTWNVVLSSIRLNFQINLDRYYGLWLWFPELFSRLENYYNIYPNASVTVCDIIDQPFNETGSSPFEHCDNFTPPDNQVFINAFIVAIAPLPANIWTIFHMDKLGRKFFLGTFIHLKWKMSFLIVKTLIVFSMVGSGLAAFLIWLVESSTGNLVLSCIFGAVSTMGFNALDCLGAELFPTSVRLEFTCCRFIKKKCEMN